MKVESDGIPFSKSVHTLYRYDNKTFYDNKYDVSEDIFDNKKSLMIKLKNAFSNGYAQGALVKWDENKVLFKCSPPNCNTDNKGSSNWR